MKFIPIQTGQWDRQPYFDHYFNQSRCTFSMTANIDITLLLNELKKREMKLYPAFLYMLSRVVNAHVEFRMDIREEQVGYWEQMSPSYTIFHPENNTFSAIWTDYYSSYERFLEHYREDQLRYRQSMGLFTKINMPSHTFSVSMIPWVSFTGFNLNLDHGGSYLLPIITGGKFFKEHQRVLLPVSLQVHHAVCDGYHAGMFMHELQQHADTYADWMD
ncbi:type A chloramphenicol O-acetyltransferase [Paenibacillus sp. XY044]|uniref:type A chloramphenicol O-acetyltransferase n=1 Tax=Paenibacillus sp. XY044 TaxID=2026089 RepID=UPI000B98951D|nr:type A chloramphenicol O-acetyltransferase [Paenibacillus sp. XY044]OZB95065.1 type A chloramphenicol O-acetyltransferase [Paenibacillus sp. XY044]